MKKRFLPTLVAFIVLIILLVYANFYETGEILAPGAQKPEPIMGCAASEITSIAWKAADEIQFKLSIASESAQIVIPQTLPADSNEAAGLARHFAELKYEMVVAENATDSSIYGIDSDSPTVVVEAGKRSWELHLGNKSEIAGSYYLARKDDPRVFMVPGYIRGDFAKTVDDLRDRRWFAEDFGQITAVTIAMPESTVELRLGDSYSEWFIDSPASYSADGVAVAELIERLRNLRVSNFIADQPDPAIDYGFASPSLMVSVRNRFGETFAIEVGETAGPESYVRKTGQVAVHASLNSVLDELKRTVDDLRDKYLAIPSHDSITEITVADASASITIERKDKRWLIGDQIVADGDIKVFLGSLAKARIFSFGPLKKLEEHGLQDKEQCGYIDIKEADNRFTLWMGTRQGVNLSVMTKDELILMSSEAEDALELLMHRISSVQKERVLAGQNSLATESSSPATENSDEK